MNKLRPTSLRGLTLVEVMVSSSIVLLLSGLVLGFLSGGLRDSSNSQSLIGVQQQAYSGMHFMTRFLAASDIHSVNINSGAQPVFACLSAANSSGVLQYNANGNSLGHILWQNYVVFYYTPSQQTLRMGLVRLSSPTTQPSPYRLTSFRPRPGDRIVASNVTAFSTVAADGLNVPSQNPITITLQCTTPQSAAIGTHQYSTTLTSSVIMDDSATNGEGAPLNDVFFQVTPTPPAL